MQRKDDSRSSFALVWERPSFMLRRMGVVIPSTNGEREEKGLALRRVNAQTWRGAPSRERSHEVAAVESGKQNEN